MGRLLFCMGIIVHFTGMLLAVMDENISFDEKSFPGRPVLFRPRWSLLWLLFSDDLLQCSLMAVAGGTGGGEGDFEG